MPADMLINVECESCLLRGKEKPCTRIMREWKRRGSVRRPEVVALLFRMLTAHPEAHCIGLSPSIDEIESRPSAKAHKPVPAKEKPVDGIKPLPEPEKKPVPAIMIGRMPRRDVK